MLFKDDDQGKIVSFFLITFLCFLDTLAPPAQLPADGPDDSDRIGNFPLFAWVWRLPTTAQVFIAVLSATLVVIVWAKVALTSRKQKLHPIDGSTLHKDRGNTSSWTMVSTMFSVLGYLLRLWSKHTLKASFTYQISVPMELIKEGPYQWLIHPGYSGSLLIVLGFIMFVAMNTGTSSTKLTFNVRVSFALVLFAIAINILQKRLDDEELMLVNHFGQAWINHASTRWRLVPFVF
mmetsp:Transcript_113/g.141  ORF Transcript_113/g.141 Transcript_113/m.141 type:complete len:235 (-) Transcript_113:147-851(-)